MSYYQEPVPQQPDPYSAYPYQDFRTPRGLAIASAILAGVVVVLQVGAGLTAPAAADAFARAADEGRPAADVLTVYDAFTILLFPALLAAYIVTCVWLTRSRGLLEQRGSSYHHSRSKVWVWLGWWVPIVSLWFPYQVVRDVRRASRPGHPAGPGLLAGWWTCWLGFQIGSQVTAQMTGDTEPSDPSTFDVLPWFEVANTVLIVVALVCWLGIIRQTTRGQEATRADAALPSAPGTF